MKQHRCAHDASNSLDFPPRTDVTKGNLRYGKVQFIDEDTKLFRDGCILGIFGFTNNIANVPTPSWMHRNTPPIHSSGLNDRNHMFLERLLRLSKGSVYKFGFSRSTRFGVLSECAESTSTMVEPLLAWLMRNCSVSVWLSLFINTKAVSAC